EKAFTVYTGGTTGERFVTYLRETLIPTLKKDDIVVMDNLRSHHVDAVGDLLRQNGITPLYLPPYSPDLNPIEKM
ncbi:MAG: transposase, partial [Phascolarctobacterium sp.]|nr:transposase [Phascolarctobacterium sp.]